MSLRNKKGDVNWFLISLIIIIVSLAVIVLIILRLNLSEDTDRATCMESAVLRASLTNKVDIKNVIPLKCKTKRICVTSNSFANGECEDGLGEKYTTYRLTGNDEAKENQIKMILAREMADCWNMLGEGNLMIFTTDVTTTSINGKAVICSRVMFDKTVTNKFETIEGMNNYLLTHKVPGKDVSYWDYFRNADDGDTLLMLNGEMVKGTITSSGMLNDQLNLKEQKAIFYLESSVSDMGSAIGAFAGVAGSVLLLGSFGGAGFKSAAILGRVATGSKITGSIAGPLAVLGFAGFKGWEAGKELYKEWILPGLPKDQDSVAGVFLTDYSYKGFQAFQSSTSSVTIESIS